MWGRLVIRRESYCHCNEKLVESDIYFFNAYIRGGLEISFNPKYLPKVVGVEIHAASKAALRAQAYIVIS